MLTSLTLITFLALVPQADSTGSAASRPDSAPASQPASQPSAVVDVAALVDEGRELMRVDRELGIPKLEKAIRILTKQTAAAPSDAGAWFLLGRASFYVNQDLQAAVAFDKVIALDPKHAEAHFFRGLVHMYAGEVKDALTNLQAAILLDPTKPHFTVEFSRLLHRVGRPEQALAALDVALETHTDDAKLHQQAGNLAYEMGKYPEAKGYFRRSAELDPRDTNTLYNLGQVEKNLGNLEAAQMWFERVVDVEPKYWHALAKVVQLAEMRGDTEARDSSRERLFALRRAGTIPSLVEEAGYYRDRFEVGDVIVVVEERFVRQKPWYQQFIFFVLDENEERKDYLFSYGSMDETTEIARESGGLGENERMWHVDQYMFDEAGAMQGHSLVSMSATELPYDQLKEIVSAEIAAHEAGDATSKPQAGSATSQPRD